MGNPGQVFVHAVWATFGRAPMIAASRKEQLYGAMRRKAIALGCEAIAIGGTSDHVHLLARVVPSVSVARLVGEIKGFSSYLANRELEPGPLFRWQERYWVSSIAREDLGAVESYLFDQEDHHRHDRLRPDLEPPSEQDGAVAP
jgi:REP element-mobilizing transposase RayT